MGGLLACLLPPNCRPGSAILVDVTLFVVTPSVLVEGTLLFYVMLAVFDVILAVLVDVTLAVLGDVTLIPNDDLSPKSTSSIAGRLRALALRIGVESLQCRFCGQLARRRQRNTSIWFSFDNRLKRTASVRLALLAR